MKAFSFSIIALISLEFLIASGGSNHDAGSHEGGWMEKWLSFDPGLFMWSIVTFLIVLFILKWKAWGPLMKALDKREVDIRDALSSAEKAKKDAEKASQDYEDLVVKARLEAQKIIADGKIAGERMKNDIEIAAEEKANNIIEKAKVQIESERQKAIEEIKSTVIDIAIEAATKIIEKNLNTEDNKKLVNQTIDQLGNV